MSSDSPLALALTLSIVVKAILDFAVQPVYRKWPNADLWWFDWVALALGGIAGWCSGINLFGMLTSTVLGQVLTALLIGGGANLINSIFATNGLAKLIPNATSRDVFDGTMTELTVSRRRGW